MKIIGRAEFLELPTGTLFAKYSPCIFGDLCIKGKSRANDFYAVALTDGIKSDGTDDWIAAITQAEKGTVHIEMDFDTECRDGLFDQDQRFAVYSTEDTTKLIKRLQEALAASNLLNPPQNLLNPK